MEEENNQDNQHNFMIKIIAILLIILIVVMIIPNYIIKVNAKFYYSKINVVIKDVKSYVKYLKLNNTKLDYYEQSLSEDDEAKLRMITSYIVNNLCSDYDQECYVKALYYFTRDYVRYVNDPVGKEYIQNPLYTLKIGAGDCDDHAILLSRMLNSIGIKNELIFVKNHIYNKVYFKVKGFLKDKSVAKEIDTTCKSCEF